MNGGIVFRSRQQEVEVYMEEELLYKYPEKELIGQSLPGNWNFVMLPKDCEGENTDSEDPIPISEIFRPDRGGLLWKL